MSRLMHSFLPLALGAALCVAAAPTWATETANTKLPPNDWGCQLCHGASEVTVDAVPDASVLPLTDLGVEWFAQAAQESGRLWSDLAAGNVDGDGCTNGFELGDPSGSYLPGGAPRTGNNVHDPNIEDCSLPISEESWSRLKALFDDN